MKKSVLILGIAALCALFTACMTDTVDSPVGSETVETYLTVTASGDPETRTTLDGDKNVLWDNSGEQMTVACKTSEGSLFATSSDGVAAADRKTAIFAFTLSLPTVSEYVYGGIYPASVVTAGNTDASACTVNLKSEQAATATTYDPLAYLMMAKAQSFSEVQTSITQSFRRITALNKVTLKNLTLQAGEEITDVSFTASEGKFLAGDRTIDLTTNVMNSVEAGSRTVTAAYAVAPVPVVGAIDVWFTSWGVEVAQDETLTVVVITNQRVLSRTITAGASGIRFAEGCLNNLSINMSTATTGPVLAGAYLLATAADTDADEVFDAFRPVIVNPSSTNYPLYTSGTTDAALSLTELEVYAASETAVWSWEVDRSSGNQFLRLYTRPDNGYVAFGGGTTCSIGTSRSALRMDDQTTLGIYPTFSLFYTQAPTYIYFAPSSVQSTVSRSATNKTIFITIPHTPVANVSSVYSYRASSYYSALGNRATLNGRAIFSFLSVGTNITACGFEYKVMNTGDDYVSITADNFDNETQRFSATVTGLSADVRYESRAWAKLNDGPKVYSTSLDFTPRASDDVYTKITDATVPEGKYLLVIEEKDLTFGPITSASGLYLSAVDVSGFRDGNQFYCAENTEACEVEIKIHTQGTCGGYDLCVNGNYNGYSYGAGDGVSDYMKPFDGSGQKKFRFTDAPETNISWQFTKTPNGTYLIKYTPYSNGDVYLTGMRISQYAVSWSASLTSTEVVTYYGYWGLYKRGSYASLGQGTGETLGTPSPSVADNTATWKVVPGADSYEYRIDGGEVQTTLTNSVSMAALSLGTHTIQVRALDTTGVNNPSEWSAARSATVTLPAPVPTASLDTISWPAIEGAASYSYKLVEGWGTTGEWISTTETSVSLANIPVYTHYYFWVMAIHSNEEYNSSANRLSAYTPYALTAPTVTVSGEVVSWSAVNGAATYTLSYSTSENHSGETTINFAANSRQFDMGSRGAGTYYIYVRANSDGTTHRNSEWSEVVTVTVTPRLSAPTGLQLNKGFEIKWNASTNASSYDYYVDEVKRGNTTSTSVDLYGTIATGSHTIWVVANATDYKSSDNAVANVEIPQIYVPITIAQATAGLANGSKIIIAYDASHVLRCYNSAVSATSLTSDYLSTRDAFLSNSNADACNFRLLSKSIYYAFNSASGYLGSAWWDEEGKYTFGFNDSPTIGDTESDYWWRITAGSTSGRLNLTTEVIDDEGEGVKLYYYNNGFSFYGSEAPNGSSCELKVYILQDAPLN